MQTSLSFIQCVVVFKMFGVALGLVEASGPEERTTTLDGQLLDKIDQYQDQMTILGDQLMGRIVRTRRGLGYKMHCVPITKKVCKIIKFKEKDTQFCTQVVSEKCYSIDKKNKQGKAGKITGGQKCVRGAPLCK